MTGVQYPRRDLTGLRLGRTYVPGFSWPGRTLLTHADLKDPGRAQDPGQEESKWNMKYRVVEERGTEILSGP